MADKSYELPWEVEGVGEGMPFNLLSGSTHNRLDIVHAQR